MGSLILIYFCCILVYKILTCTYFNPNLSSFMEVLNCQKRFELLLPIEITHLLHMEMTLLFLSVLIRLDAVLWLLVDMITFCRWQFVSISIPAP